MSNSISKGKWSEIIQSKRKKKKEKNNCKNNWKQLRMSLSWRKSLQIIIKMQLSKLKLSKLTNFKFPGQTNLAQIASQNYQKVTYLQKAVEAEWKGQKLKAKRSIKGLKLVQQNKIWSMAMNDLNEFKPLTKFILFFG